MWTTFIAHPKAHLSKLRVSSCQDTKIRMRSEGKETKDDRNWTNALPQDRCASIQDWVPNRDDCQGSCRSCDCGILGCMCIKEACWSGTCGFVHSASMKALSYKYDFVGSVLYFADGCPLLLTLLLLLDRVVEPTIFLSVPVCRSNLPSCLSDAAL